MDGSERSPQVRDGATQGYNCFLYFHFPHYQGQGTKSVSQITNTFFCMCVSVCLCSLSSNNLTDRDQGSCTNCLSEGHRSRKSRRSQLEVLGFCCFPFSSLFITLRLETGAVRQQGDHHYLHPTGHCSFSLLAETEKAQVCALCNISFVVFFFSKLIPFIHLVLISLFRYDKLKSEERLLNWLMKSEGPAAFGLSCRWF